MMAQFIAKRLSVLAYAPGGFTLFHYHHMGPLDEVLEPGFFAEESAEFFAHRHRIAITAADAVADAVCDSRAEPMTLVLTMRADVPAWSAVTP